MGMFLSFSVVGPFTGSFIDRWRRRQTLLAGNLLRAGLIVATALVMEAAGVGIGVYALVLVALLVCVNLIGDGVRDAFDSSSKSGGRA